MKTKISECSALYIVGPPVHFSPGQVIRWRLHLQFISKQETTLDQQAPLWNQDKKVRAKSRT